MPYQAPTEMPRPSQVAAVARHADAPLQHPPDEAAQWRNAETTVVSPAATPMDWPSAGRGLGGGGSYSSWALRCAASPWLDGPGAGEDGGAGQQPAGDEAAVGVHGAHGHAERRRGRAGGQGAARGAGELVPAGLVLGLLQQPGQREAADRGGAQQGTVDDRRARSGRSARRRRWPARSRSNPTPRRRWPGGPWPGASATAGTTARPGPRPAPGPTTRRVGAARGPRSRFAPSVMRHARSYGGRHGRGPTSAAAGGARRQQRPHVGGGVHQDRGQHAARAQAQQGEPDPGHRRRQHRRGHRGQQGALGEPLVAAPVLQGGQHVPEPEDARGERPRPPGWGSGAGPGPAGRSGTPAPRTPRCRAGCRARRGGASSAPGRVVDAGVGQEGIGGRERSDQPEAGEDRRRHRPAEAQAANRPSTGDQPRSVVVAPRPSAAPPATAPAAAWVSTCHRSWTSSWSTTWNTAIEAIRAASAMLRRAPVGSIGCSLAHRRPGVCDPSVPGPRSGVGEPVGSLAGWDLRTRRVPGPRSGVCEPVGSLAGGVCGPVGSWKGNRTGLRTGRG